jgi:3-oxoisoapionate decarboxylase
MSSSILLAAPALLIQSWCMNRRHFLKTTVATVASSSIISAQEEASGKKPRFGFDNFAIRALGWKAGQLLDYAAGQKVTAILFSDLDVYESHDDSYLAELSRKAQDLGIQIYVGTGGICPSAHRFSDKWGDAPTMLSLTLKIANRLGSPVARCYQGFSEDRRSPGGIAARNQDTLKVLASVRRLALDLGVKIAIENHAGDMQGWELARLIEQAGPEFVGATIDPGNATWTLEDPMDNLEALGPHILCSGIRNSVVWETGEGAQCAWTSPGEGLIDMKAYAQRFFELAPDAPFIVETISGFSRPFPYLLPGFWKGYEEIPAKNFAAFVALAKKGKPVPPFEKPAENAKEAEHAYQKSDLEKSLRWCEANLNF